MNSPKISEVFIALNRALESLFGKKYNDSTSLHEMVEEVVNPILIDFSLPYTYQTWDISYWDSCGCRIIIGTLEHTLKPDKRCRFEMKGTIEKLWFTVGGRYCDTYTAVRYNDENDLEKIDTFDYLEYLWKVAYAVYRERSIEKRYKELRCDLKRMSEEWKKAEQELDKLYAEEGKFKC